MAKKVEFKFETTQKFISKYFKISNKIWLGLVEY